MHYPIIAAVLTVPVLATAGEASKPFLNFDAAQEVVSAALDYARAHHAPGGAVALVDDGGHLVALARLDGTFPAAPDIAAGKARTAALFQRPTRGLEEAVNGGRVTMTKLPRVTSFTPLQGGVPIQIGGHVVGAIGVSGAASAQQDDEIAQAAVDATAAKLNSAQAAAPTDHVVHVEAAKVKSAFAKGGALFESAGFKVHASRRDGPGEAEVHEHDTDIFYVQEGSARVVTGGELVDARTTAPGEIRARTIRNGATLKLAAGDVIVIPKGVPHLFEQVSAPFTYYVVKATD